MMPKPLSRAVLPTCLALAGVAACSSSGAMDGTGASGVSPVTASDPSNAAKCPTWTSPLDSYVPPVVHRGASGLYTFSVTDISPGPPALANMVWQLELTDAAGQPVKGATFPLIKTWMPQHMHPSTALPDPHDNGDGTYTISNVYLFMAGVWQVTFNVQVGSSADSAVFTFCLGT